MNSRSRDAILIVAALAISAGAGIGIGWGLATTVPASGSVTTVTATGGAQGETSVTLVITTGNAYNSTIGDQPAYYVLGPDGLKSSANLTFPSNSLIKLTIICYDDGNASLVDPQDANVQGTVNGTITYANNDDVNSSQGANGIIIQGGQTVTSVPTAMIAHTFTITALKLNIPVPLSSTVVAYFKTGGSGTFQWFCMTACGSGPAGTAGAMETPGWMTGDLEVT